MAYGAHGFLTTLGNRGCWNEVALVLGVGGCSGKIFPCQHLFDDGRGGGRSVGKREGEDLELTGDGAKPKTEP